MALLPSVSTKITVELTRYRSAVSEFLAQTLGKSINYLIDKTDQIDTDVTSLIASINTQYGFSSATAYSGNGITSVTAASDEYVIIFGTGNFVNDGSTAFVTKVLAPTQSATYYRPVNTPAMAGMVVVFKKLAVSI